MFCIWTVMFLLKTKKNSDTPNKNHHPPNDPRTNFHSLFVDQQEIKPDNVIPVNMEVQDKSSILRLFYCLVQDGRKKFCSY